MQYSANILMMILQLVKKNATPVLTSKQILPPLGWNISLMQMREMKKSPFRPNHLFKFDTLD